jgi:hypothetical protein
MRLISKFLGGTCAFLITSLWLITLVMDPRPDSIIVAVAMTAIVAIAFVLSQGL